MRSRPPLPDQQGAIFTPAVTRMFRAIIADSRGDLEIWLFHLHQQLLNLENVHPQVNEPYAIGETRELPRVLLRKLPPLAGDLPYRLIHFDDSCDGS